MVCAVRALLYTVFSLIVGSFVSTVLSIIILSYLGSPVYNLHFCLTRLG